VGVKLLITGAGGTLGSTLAGVARDLGYPVAALGRGELDITDPGQVEQVFSVHRPEAVVNCAAFSDVDAAQTAPGEAMAVNRDGARLVAEAAAGTGAAMVHISTDYVFDGNREVPYRPEDQPAPLNLYGITKLAGEAAVLESHPEPMVLRTSWIFGGDARGFVEWVRGELLREGPPLTIVEDERSRPTWCLELARGILELLERGAAGVHHLANRGECSRLELAEEIRTLQGTHRTLEGITGEAFGAPARRPHYSVLALDSTEAVLGRTLPHWKDSLRRYLTR